MARKKKVTDIESTIAKMNHPDILKDTTSQRPADYTPQPGNKAMFTIADFSDENIFAELRRRGYNGELRFCKVITV